MEYPSKSKGEIIDVWRNITVGELAQILGKDIEYVQDIFLNKVRGNNAVIADIKELRDAIKRGGKRMRVIGKPSDNKEVEDRDVFRRPPAKESDLKPRPAVVTVMGHVDHGKTTLLDALRHTNIVKTEFGGITQHIGAFSVCLPSGNQITFLDTPGHAAFTAMRERGASITDIVVLVVAADDGVMEQTIESIRMAKQANVPILIAINKIDAPGADIERTKHMLVQAGIQVESMGGDVQAVPISALKRQNLDQLTEALILQAELLNVRADPSGLVEGVVVESKVDPYRGKLCTIIVQRGTLRKGNVLVCGTTVAKARTIKDANGRTLPQAPPGYPAEVDGWKDLPSAGETVLEVENEKQAKAAIRVREAKKQLQKQKEDAVVIAAKAEQHSREYKEKLQKKRSLGRFKLKPEGPRKPEIQKDDGSPVLNIILKCDVDGTLEAILGTLDTYESSDCELELIHYGVGAITASDIELAKTFKGLIYAFNVDCPERFEKLANELEVPIKHHNVIYKLVDDVKEEINTRLPTVEVEEVVGEATVLQQFNIGDGRKTVPVAGCRCIKGILKRSSLYKLIRDGNTIYEGHLTSMRHLKEEVDVIKKDSECGIQLATKDIQFQHGDILICFEKKSQSQTTDWDPGF